ncbi:MAG: serine hydrolase [Bacillota bacterium]
MRRHLLVLLAIAPTLIMACQLTIAPPETPPPPVSPAGQMSPPDAASAAGASGPYMRRLEEEVRAITAAAEGHYGVYARLLGTDFELTVAADRPFFAASSYKIPLVLHLYERALEGEIDLTESIVLTDEHLAPGAGILKEEKPGSHHRLDYLASLAIVYSDNTAAHMLLERLGLSRFKQYQADLGAESVPADRNLASPRDIGLFLERLLTLHSRHPEHFSEVLVWMQASQPRDRIPAGLPAGVRVANKTGTWPGTFNDVALIQSGDSTSILVVMSEGVPSYGEGITVIARIAEVVYSELHTQAAD